LLTKILNMKIIISTTLFVQMFLSMTVIGQNNQMEGFNVLVGSTWVFEGTQLGGHEGKTEQQFEFGLDGKIVKVKTYSTDPITLQFGLRNEGVRSFNAADSLIYFYEFDKNGGITTGTVTVNKNDLYYDYKYNGLMLRDSWEYVDADTYLLIVGIWDGKVWKQKFQEAKFVRKK
jgi:hypothetical protein